MVPDHLEMMVTWTAEPSVDAARWFEERGFSAKPLRAGLLLNAPRSLVESEFSVAIGKEELPLKVPVPKAQERAVASITVLKPRDYVQQQRKQL